MFSVVVACDIGCPAGVMTIRSDDMELVGDLIQGNRFLLFLKIQIRFQDGMIAGKSIAI